VNTPFDLLFADQAPAGKRGRGKSAPAAHSAESSAFTSPRELARTIQSLERDMRAAARELEFERAAELRDRISALRNRLMLAESD
jgi:excinuclease ABC subunit B